MLGARIAALRRQAGLSQTQLARQLQISPSAVGMYEQGRREPSTELLVALARTLNVTVDYLLTGEPTAQERRTVDQAVELLLADAQLQLDKRQKRPLSRQELAVLFAALLMEG